MLLNMLLDFALERNLIPMIVECDDSVSFQDQLAGESLSNPRVFSMAYIGSLNSGMSNSE